MELYVYFKTKNMLKKQKVLWNYLTITSTDSCYAHHIFIEVYELFSIK